MEVEAGREFGCEVCWPSSADQAWEAIGKLAITDYLIDDTHFIVSLRRCQACSQTFVSILTETIDWQDGEDPQYRTVMPLLQQEVTDLARVEEEEIEHRLQMLAPQRRTLKSDYPKGKGKTQYWSHGISLRPHD